ncbi:MAG: TIGR00282 family metallophosphoesterase [Deltaproteobacteria bacterium]|nr:TIGR00282 family metallophosphoesterase [Deltaproteobacteria bacterium]
MKLLFVGDVVGKPGRRALSRMLPSLVDKRSIDYTVVNIENAAGGFGVTPEILRELDELPIDCFSSGNHIWDKREGLQLLDQRADFLRPANYPKGNPGHGLYVGETAAGIPVATLNLEGCVFMSNLDSPFAAADRLLAELPANVKVILVDFHAEATSEKQAMAFHLDGRVSAVFGTHTHVPTADERVLPGGTALITDVGMTGPYDGIIGFRADRSLQRFLLQTHVRLEVAKKDVRLAGAVVDVDESTGQARTVERLLLPDYAS